MTFGYHEKEVLHQINMHIPAGTVTALVCPSGSGKSTIAKLIASLWDVKEGSIPIGGMDIRMGRPGATDAEVEDVAKRSGCHDFILQCEAGYGTVAAKRIEIAEHLRYLPMSYFNQNSLGYITSVTTNTMEQVGDVATRVVMLTTQGILTTLLIALMLLFYDWRIGLVVLVGLALFFLTNSQMQKKSEAVSPRKIAADSALIEKLLEYIQGITEVKAYNLIGNTSQKLNTAIDENRDGNITMEKTFIPYISVQTLIAKGTGIVMSLLSIWLYLNGTMDIDGRDIAPKSHDIALENISFSYEKRKIIDSIQLHIPQGTTTAIVGPENEKDLVNAIEALTREKTILMIAHRLKTVQNADQILVVNQDKIVQQGKHEELMQQDGIYKRFVNASEAAASCNTPKKHTRPFL